MQMITMMGVVRWASTQSDKYQFLTKVRLRKALSKNRIGKISEINPSTLMQEAVQDQNRQNHWNQHKCVETKHRVRTVSAKFLKPT